MCEYPNFEAQKASFFGLQTVRPDLRPFRKFTESMPIWYLKRSENYEDRRTGPGIFFWGSETPRKASGTKRLASPPATAAPAAGHGGGCHRPPDKAAAAALSGKASPPATAAPAAGHGGGCHRPPDKAAAAALSGKARYPSKD
ncbi:hypothetical protein JCGZ_05176 [Jatropha curcas]|uniref:Uncharacterized protein n=1 Tax=Jatropha curcas TaxID=180498 RepID=A0A067L1D3_JATCU|nr:hypothetical protein JCGZ_05176 [Jatropha curcas]